MKTASPACALHGRLSHMAEESMGQPRHGAASPRGGSSRDEGARLLREGGKLSLLTLISRILGLVREMTRAAFMGTGALADAFTMAFMIPNLLRRLFAEGSISVAFIPTFKGYLVEGDARKTREFLSASFTVLLILVLAATALGIALAPWIVLLFKSDPYETTVLTRLMFPFLALVSFAALLQGVLNAEGVFVPSGYAPILFNICYIGVPWLIAPFMPNPARALAVGVLVGGLAQALCQLPAVLRAGHRFGFTRPDRAFHDPGVRKVLALIAPTILGMAAYQLNELVCTAVASRAGTGVATSLTFSLRLLELVLGIFAVSAGTVLLPELTGAAKAEDWPRFSSRLGKALDLIALVTVPVAVFAMAMGREIVVLLFQQGAFTEDSVALTTRIFFFHMIGLYFIAANRVLAPAFYAREDTKSPTWAGIASFGLNIAFAIAFVGPFSGGGIALALSIASAVNTILLVLLLVRARIEGLLRAFRSSLGALGRLCLYSFVALVPLLILKAPLAGLCTGALSKKLAAAATLVLGALVYGFVGVSLLVLFREESASLLLRGFRRKKR